MEDDLRPGLAQRRRDLILECYINIVILDGGKTIMGGVQVDDGYSRLWIKLEQPLDHAMAQRATTSNHEGGFDGLRGRHDRSGYAG